MHARVVTNPILPNKMEAWAAIVRESIVPFLRLQPGFRGIVVMTDSKTGGSIGYSMWETEGDRIACERRGEYQRRLAELRVALEMGEATVAA